MTPTAYALLAHGTDRILHRHHRGCYWDHRRAGWVCPGTTTAGRTSRDRDA